MSEERILLLKICIFKVEITPKKIHSCLTVFSVREIKERMVVLLYGLPV